MIGYECINMENLVEALESLAYKLARYEHPDWYMIPEEEIIDLLNAEGIRAFKDE